MARLIDADTVNEHIVGWVDLRGCPTIEAIPIKWIKKYIAEEGIYPNRELLSVEQADAIERMIENWEKENETN